MTQPATPASFAAVIFDMDGLLLDTEAMARRSLIHAGGVFGLDVDLRFCESLVGIPADGSRLLFAGRFGASAPAEDYFSEATRHLAAEIDAGRMNMKKGARGLLASLARAGIPHAVATSSSRDKALHHLQKAGIAQDFEAISTRSDVARGKPFPDVYLHAASRLGVAPGACLALEDSYNGVRSAHAAGMAVVMVPDLLPPTGEMRALCLAVVPDLGHIVRLLREPAGSRRVTGLNSSTKETAMTDDSNSTDDSGVDRKLISLKEDHEIRDWTTSLGCTEGQLRDAVAVVGNSAARVRELLTARPRLGARF